MKTVLQAGFIILAGIVLALSINAASREPLAWIREPKYVDKEKWPVLSAEEVLQHIEDGTAILIDARDANEYEAGHIASAINIPETDFINAFAEYGETLPRDISLIVYCQGGECDQSHAVLERLGQFDFQILMLYPGGWNEWSEKGYLSEP